MYAMPYAYRQLNETDLPLYKALMALFREMYAEAGYASEVSSDSEMQTELAAQDTIFVIAQTQSSEEVFGGLVASDSNRPEYTFHEIFVDRIDVPKGPDTSTITEGLIEELKNIAHERGANNLYLTHFEDNRDIPIRIPPRRKK